MFAERSLQEQPLLLQAGARRVLESLRAPGQAVEVFALERRRVVIIAQGTKVCSTVETDESGFAVRLVQDQRCKFVYTSGVPDSQTAHRLLADTVCFEVPFDGFASAGDDPVPDGLFDPRLGALQTAEAVSGIEQTLAAARQADAAIRVTDCSFTFGVEQVALCHSAGRDGAYARTFAEVELEINRPRAGQDDLGAQYIYSCHYQGLDWEQIGARAARIALGSFNQQAMPSREVTVVFGPYALASLIEDGLLPVLTSRNGASVPRLPDHLRIWEDPHLPGGINSAPWDDEGVSTRRKLLFDHDGVGQVHTLSDGQPSTGNGYRVPLRSTCKDYRASPRLALSNVVVEGRTQPWEQLIGQVSYGVLIPLVIGTHFSSQREIRGTAFNARLLRKGRGDVPLLPFEFKITADDLWGRLDSLGDDVIQVRPFPWWSPVNVVCPSARTGALRVHPS